MQTRQKARRKINVPGRYFTGVGAPVDVVLRDISEGGCRFPVEAAHLAIGAPVQIFVGTSGPHRAAVRWVSGGEVGIKFAAPLPAHTIAQFQNSHIPDPSDPAATGGFAPMSPDPQGTPRRFC
jgi:hypothetical protein